VLAPPRKEGELGGLRANLGYLGAVLDGQGYGAERLVASSTEDPDELEAALWSLPRHAPPVPAAYLPMGNKRALARQALDHLHAKAPAPAGVVPLPAGAPFGTLGSTSRAARSASPASRSARPGRCSTTPSGRRCASWRTPASSAACARTPARSG
jgi:hypothetical protein